MIDHLLISSVLVLSLGSAACSNGSSGGDGNSNAPTTFKDSQTIVSFTDGVILPTYQLLADRTNALHAATKTLVTEPTEANLQAAQSAWIASREPWEQSEGFLFGPVDNLGYDPALDSWPIDRTQIDQILRSDQNYSAADIARMDGSVRGFHTAEYLLFGADHSRKVAELNAAHLAYLVVVTEDLHNSAQGLVNAWTVEHAGESPYRLVFTSAGSSANTSFPSLSAAAQQMLNGMVGIADEVANGKIADPFDNQDVTLVESPFSYNSLTDFVNNLISLQMVWEGRRPEADSNPHSLEAFVRANSPALAIQMNAQTAEAIAALRQIPEPFNRSALDPAAKTKVMAAQEAIRALQTTLEGQVLQLILGPK